MNSEDALKEIEKYEEIITDECFNMRNVTVITSEKLVEKYREANRVIISLELLSIFVGIILLGFLMWPGILFVFFGIFFLYITCDTTKNKREMYKELNVYLKEELEKIQKI